MTEWLVRNDMEQVVRLHEHASTEPFRGESRHDCAGGVGPIAEPDMSQSVELALLPSQYWMCGKSGCWVSMAGSRAATLV